MDKPVDNSLKTWDWLGSPTCLLAVDKHMIPITLFTISVEKSTPTWGLICINIWLSTSVHRLD